MEDGQTILLAPMTMDERRSAVIADIERRPRIGGLDVGEIAAAITEGADDRPFDRLSRESIFILY